MKDFSVVVYIVTEMKVAFYPIPCVMDSSGPASIQHEMIASEHCHSTYLILYVLCATLAQPINGLKPNTNCLLASTGSPQS